MLFTISAVLALSVATSAALDIGGPHGNQAEWKRDAYPVHRRHHARNHQKRCAAQSTSSTAYTATTTAVASLPTQQAVVSNSSSSSSNSLVAGAVNVDLDSLGITGFQGQPNTGAIGSWFRTDNSEDDTNGRSWCQTNYQDTWMGFAPSVDTMLSNFGGDLAKAATAYCGLEAKATDPATGNTALMYIVDGFADPWVLTPTSVDLTLAAFKALYGSNTDDKNIVIQNLQWEFTGNRMQAYGYNAGS